MNAPSLSFPSLCRGDTQRDPLRSLSPIRRSFAVRYRARRDARAAVREERAHEAAHGVEPTPHPSPRLRYGAGSCQRVGQPRQQQHDAACRRRKPSGFFGRQGQFLLHRGACALTPTPYQTLVPLNGSPKKRLQGDCLGHSLTKSTVAQNGVQVRAGKKSSGGAA